MHDKTLLPDSSKSYRTKYFHRSGQRRANWRVQLTLTSASGCVNGRRPQTLRKRGTATLERKKTPRNASGRETPRPTVFMPPPIEGRTKLVRAAERTRKRDRARVKGSDKEVTTYATKKERRRPRVSYSQPPQPPPRRSTQPTMICAGRHRVPVLKRTSAWLGDPSQAKRSQAKRARAEPSRDEPERRSISERNGQAYADRREFG
ncbi:hypothetical protein PUN28_002647 [Cardiocondyla obscurior]|uniref:Uncharacterized protein n=1 Tax=Cardiocondyla obscurior TaxID=286306 RepID=A0AAW2GVA5_9HYME